MMALVTRSTDLAGHRTAIARLAAELHVPLYQVREIYQAQLDRLGAEARIESYLGVLAARNTRSILRRCEDRSSEENA